MNIKNSLLILGVFAVLSSCNSKGPEKTTSSSNPNLHKVLVEDVLQTTNYTYLHVKENNAENWLAVPAMQARSGETYYYQGGMTMNNFESKELKRSFETVIFLEKVSADPTLLDKPAAPATVNAMENSATPATGTAAPADTAGYTRPAPVIEKKEVKVQPAKGGITIADLFAKKESFAGKTVKITGQVTKYTPGVTNEITPAQIDDKVREQLESKASYLYRHLNCRGVVRMDFILQKQSQKLFFLEVNTMPGQSENSIVPQQVRASGRNLKDFYGELLDDCLKSHQKA